MNDLTIDHLGPSSAVAIPRLLDAKIVEGVTEMQDIVNVIFLKAERKKASFEACPRNANIVQCRKSLRGRESSFSERHFPVKEEKSSARKPTSGGSEFFSTVESPRIQGEDARRSIP